MAGHRQFFLVSCGFVALSFLVLSVFHRISPSSDLSRNEDSQLTPEETRLRAQNIVKAREDQLLHTIRDLKHVMKRQIQKIGMTQQPAEHKQENELKKDLHVIDKAWSKLRKIDHVKSKTIQMSQSTSDQSKLEKEASKYDSKAKSDLMKSQKYQTMAADDDKTYQQIMKTAESFDQKLRNAMEKIHQDKGQPMVKRQIISANPPRVHHVAQVQKPSLKTVSKLSRDDLEIEQALKEADVFKKLVSQRLSHAAAGSHKRKAQSNILLWAKASDAASRGDWASVHHFCSQQKDEVACRKVLAKQASSSPCDPLKPGYMKCLGIRATGAPLT
mmetsp:Transcript_6659/g.15310  ORF Transcript_6659/g.15310 Transcript_6659/m.15310 type:complete len:330 (-) Transcript_6659:85-1074(-)